MGAVPEELIGLWKRESIAIADGQPYEDSEVYWLQTPSRYADIRVPCEQGGRFLSFAGTQCWNSPRLTFRHELDLAEDIPNDEGTLHWDGTTLVEDGTFIASNREISFRERWIRKSVKGSDYSAWEKRTQGRLIAICISIGEMVLILDGARELVAQLQKETGSRVEVLAQVGEWDGLLVRSGDWQLVEMSG